MWAPDGGTEVVDDSCVAVGRQRRLEAGAQEDPVVAERGEQGAEPQLLARGHADRPAERGGVEAVDEGHGCRPSLRGFVGGVHGGIPAPFS